MAITAEDRRQAAYLNATSLSSTELAETFLGGENQIEAIATITKTIGATTYTFRVADRPKYVGDNFYEGRAKFPLIERKMQDLQTPSLQFSTMEIQIANLDGFYNAYLEGGSTYINFIGARIVVQIGLRDVASSFVTVFDGYVQDNDGFETSREIITLRAQDQFAVLNKVVPLPYINSTDFPSAPTENLGQLIPLALGDWEAGYNYTANATQTEITDLGGATTQIVTDIPNNFFGGLVGYYVGGGYFVFSIGTYTPDTISKVHIKRGDGMMQCTFNPTPLSAAGYWVVQITGLVPVGGGGYTYVYQQGDVALISVKIPYSTGKYSNPIEMAQSVLLTLSGLSSGILDSSWATLAANSNVSYPQSDMTAIKARIWLANDQDTTLGAVMGILECVRCEMFINASGKLQVSSLFPENWPAPASAAETVYQAEINEKSIQQTADDRTFFTEAVLNYAFCPATAKTELVTARMKNANAETKATLAVPSIKGINAPWIYQSGDAVYQLKEFIRLFSTGLTFVTAEVAWIHLLLELSEIIAFNYSVGSLAWASAPMMVRGKKVNLETGSVTLNLLDLSNFAYPNYSPSNASQFLSSESQSIVNA